MRKSDLPLIDISDLNQEAVRLFQENENIIKKLLKIPAKIRSLDQNNEIRERVRRRAYLIRQFKKK